MTTFNILERRKQLINTDPQKRCYNGVHFSSELIWTEWELLEFGVKQERVEQRLIFWKELNEYAVNQRGEEALREFKLEEQTHE